MHLDSFDCTRKRRTTFAIPDLSVIHPMEGDDLNESKTYNPKNFTTDFSRQDARNICASIAARCVGTSNPTPERNEHLGKGRLRDSIKGPQHFHDHSFIDHLSTRNFDVSDFKDATHVRPQEDDSIWIDDLPGSQDSQIDPNENRDYRQGFPAGDPNNPDDNDNTPLGRGPPGGGPPSGGPPRGGPNGNQNPWVPRMPGGPHGVPGGGNPGGPPGSRLPSGGPPLNLPNQPNQP